MTRIMLDIETLATTPDACIVSIGAVTFSTAPDPIGEELHISVARESCREHGRRVDADTLEWWRTILESAYRALDCEAEAPWDYWQCRDVRTLRKCAPAWPDDREHEGVAHDALDDARHQARCVAECLRRQQAIADGGEH